MNTVAVASLVLALALVVGIVGTLRVRGRRHAVRCSLQFVAVALLYLVLFPPSDGQAVARGELVVLTPGVTASQIDSSRAATRVALPGVDAPRTVERAPDLGTALRRHDGIRQVAVLGAGLPARDRDAARGRVARFGVAPLPRGLVDLWYPERVAEGARFSLRGRVGGLSDARVELRDPAGAVVAAQPVDHDGRFQLDAFARAAGPMLFGLRVLDAGGRSVDDVPVPVAAQAGSRLHVLLLAAAPDAELKYLRRWIVDAGLDLDSRIGLSEGIALGEGHVALDPEALRAIDIAVVDQRAWTALADTEKKSLLDAVDDGLGLLLRVDATPAPANGGMLAGFALRPAPEDTAVRAFGAEGEAVAFTRAPLAIEAADAAVALRADDGSPLVLWRARGQGRIGVDLLLDSWRLVLAGHAPGHAGFWSTAFTTLARARGDAAPQPPREARVDERAVACGLADDAAVEAPDGTRTPLRIDPAAGPAGCAAYWPTQAGWHWLLAAGAREPFHVRAAGEATALALAERARATRALVGAPAAAATDLRRVPWPRWPFFLAWLAAVAIVWWLEREPRAD